MEFVCKRQYMIAYILHIINVLNKFGVLLLREPQNEASTSLHFRSTNDK